MALPISSSEELISNLYDRFTIDFIQIDEVESLYTITIKDVRKTDAGKYRCEVLISSDEALGKDVKLKIRLKGRACVLYNLPTYHCMVNQFQ